MRLVSYDNNNHGRTMLEFFVFFRCELALYQIVCFLMRRIREDARTRPVMEVITFKVESIVEECMRLSKLIGRRYFLSLDN